MNPLATTYMGLELKAPIVCSSSPLCQDLDALSVMQEAGAGAVVLHSLFEEQIEQQSLFLHSTLNQGAEAYAEAVSYFPEMENYNLGADGYLEHIREATSLLEIPVIASLNGHTRGGWIEFARQIEQAGADGLELNVYDIPTSARRSAWEIENDLVSLVRDICEVVRLPVAIKLSPTYTAPAHLGARLAEAGARALVLFNRFYQPEFDLENLEVVPSLQLSTPQELLPRLHWVAIMYGQVHADLAVTGGVHSFTDALKVIAAGGQVAMMTSALLRNGPRHLAGVIAGMREWLQTHEYESVQQMRGSMSLRSAANPNALVRGNYMQVLRSYVTREV